VGCYPLGDEGVKVGGGVARSTIAEHAHLQQINTSRDRRGRQRGRALAGSRRMMKQSSHAERTVRWMGATAALVGSADRKEELLALRPNRAPADLLIREDKLESGRLHDGRHVSQGLAHGVLHLEGAHRLADRKGRRHAIWREARQQRACRGHHGDVVMPYDPFERTGVGVGGTERMGESGWKDQYDHNVGGGTPLGREEGRGGQSDASLSSESCCTCARAQRKNENARVAREVPLPHPAPQEA